MSLIQSIKNLKNTLNLDIKAMIQFSGNENSFSCFLALIFIRDFFLSWRHGDRKYSKIGNTILNQSWKLIITLQRLTARVEQGASSTLKNA